MSLRGHLKVKCYRWSDSLPATFVFLKNSLLLGIKLHINDRDKDNNLNSPLTPQKCHMIQF